MDTARSKLVVSNPFGIKVNANPLKEQDLQLFQKLKYSLEKNGQLKSILVCEAEAGTYECLEGSKIVRAMQELNFAECFCTNLGILSDEQKKLIKLEMFKDYFLVNYTQVGVDLKQLNKTKDLKEMCCTLPFDVRQVEKLISLTEFNWDSLNKKGVDESQVNLFDLIEEEIEYTPITVEATITYEKIAESIKQVDEQPKVLSVSERIKLMSETLEKSTEPEQPQVVEEKIITSIETTPIPIESVVKKETLVVPYLVIVNDSGVNERIKEDLYLEKQLQNAILLRDSFTNCGDYLYSNK